MALFGIGKNKEKKEDAANVEEQKKDAAPKKAAQKVQKEVQKEEKKPAAATEKTPAPDSTVSAHDISRVLLKPRITEKATMGTGNSVYVFDVAPESNKRQVIQAMQKVYNVTPTKVHMTKVPSKDVRNMRTGIKGTKSGGKKAYVYLKKGETISIL